MEKEVLNNLYIGARYIEILCIAVFIFGFLWEGTEILNLSFPEFMMLYGGTGAVVTELFSRAMSKYIKKKETTTEKVEQKKPPKVIKNG